MAEKNEVAVKDITVQVLEKVKAFENAGELRIPKDYSVENAVKSAYLILLDTQNAAKKNALEVCTKASIANALLRMVVWGLSPMKKQCAFIMYGDKLECQMEYTGNIALAKRWGGMADIKANAVFSGEEFDYSVEAATGRKYIIKHNGSLKIQDEQKVIGAYAVVTMNDGSSFAEVMSMNQIKAAWNQGAMKGNSPAHKNFPDQMAIKTVISRACKLLIRGSDDSILTDNEDEYTLHTEVVDAQVENEIKTESNKQVIDFDEVKEAPKSDIKPNVGVEDPGF